MIEFTEIEDGERWELFARDFLSALGMQIESPPNRGPDGGKDMLVAERVKGKISSQPFRWLVSCKHFAASGKSVKEGDELNIRERLETLKADGFLGFYSTIPAAGLEDRLRKLRDELKIRDYQIFDNQRIEDHLVRDGHSNIMKRYFPSSYQKIRPLNVLLNEYLPLKCEICDKDLLNSVLTDPYGGNVIFICKDTEYSGEIYTVEKIYWVCKNTRKKNIVCDSVLEKRYVKEKEGEYTRWEDIGDLVIPAYFLHYVLSTMNSIREGIIKYSDEANNSLRYLFMAIAQKTLRETTSDDKKRVIKLLNSRLC